MQEGVNADGGYLVPVPVTGQWIDLLRDNIVFAQGQAHTVPWASGSTLTLPVMVTDPVVQNPNEGSDTYPPSADATVNRYQFVARPYSLLETLSWELLEDSAVDIADVIQMNMARRLAMQVQSDFIYSSASNTIQGFTGASGLLTGVEGGTANGAAPTSANGYNYVDIAIEAVRSAKVEPDLIVTSPKGFQTYGRLKNTLNDALRPSPTVQEFLSGANGKSVRLTTAVKDTQTVGTASADCSDLFVLDSSRIYWAIRHDFSVISLRERFATQRLLGVMAWQRLDATLTHAEAAYWLKGIVGS
jgi:HK97 family phage major capsid protein